MTTSARRERLADRRYHESFVFDHGGLTYTAGVGFYPDGRVAKIFLSCGKAGSHAESNARDAAILASLVLQHGVPLERIRHTLTRDDRGSHGPIGHALDLLASNEPTA